MARCRWLSANAGAQKLLGDRGTIVPRALPLESALELGINASTLEIYARCEGETLEVANFYYDQRGELKADMVKEIMEVMREWPEKRDEILQGIADLSLKYPSHFKDQIHRWETEKALAKQKEEDHQVALADAEEKEDEAKSYKPEVTTSDNVGDQPKPSEVTRRRTPSRRWFDGQYGEAAIKDVVGDMAEPLPGLISGLTGLNKKLMDQSEHCGVMHNYTEFWAGYDKFGQTPSAAKKMWGTHGRLERMRKLRGLLSQVMTRLDMYINDTAPFDGLEYPEE